MKILFALAAVAFSIAGCSDDEGSIGQITHECPEDSGTDSGIPPTTDRVDSSTDQCVTAANCVIPMGPCLTCQDGNTTCPTAECVEGTCIALMPSCPDQDAGMGDAAVE